MIRHNFCYIPIETYILYYFCCKMYHVNEQKKKEYFNISETECQNANKAFATIPFCLNTVSSTTAVCIIYLYGTVRHNLCECNQSLTIRKRKQCKLDCLCSSGLCAEYCFTLQVHSPGNLLLFG